jgi:hypothetical protein
LLSPLYFHKIHKLMLLQQTLAFLVVKLPK